MANPIKQLLAEITTPEQREADARRIAKAMINDAREKARISAPYRESYERGLAEYERRVAESRARQQERRQGGTPDAASVESKTAEVMHVDDHEDIEFRCAKCDGANVMLATRHAADEYGTEDAEDGGWCDDCGEFVEVCELALPASVLRRILAVAA
jgi:hypothetical protein